MATIELNIEFRKYRSHPELVRDLAPAFQARPADTVFILIDLDTYSMLYADMLLLVSTLVIHLRGRGIQVKGKVLNLEKDSARARYASRIDFFKLIGMDYEEDFQRWSGGGHFTEITRFTNDKGRNDFYHNLLRRVVAIVRNVNADRAVLEMLDFCLTELFDNALNHSGMPYGWASAQFFPQRREVRLIVGDTGIGIHQSLTRNPKSKFKHLNEMQAVARCIEAQVTSGEGMGNGLFVTSEFIRRNAGELLIYSGSHFLRCTASATTVTRGYRWNGTFAFMRINTDVPVDYQEILTSLSTRPDDFEFFYGADQVGDELW